MTRRHRQLVIVLVAAGWGYLVHRDVMAFGSALYQLLQSATVIAVTAAAAAAVTFVVMHPSHVRSAARDAGKTVAQTGRDIVKDITGRP
jgi:hypothetical protein